MSKENIILTLVKIVRKSLLSTIAVGERDQTQLQTQQRQMGIVNE